MRFAKRKILRPLPQGGEERSYSAYGRSSKRLMSAFQSILADLGQPPAAQAGLDQLVNFQIQILAGRDALAFLDAAERLERVLRQLVVRAGMKRVLFHG